MGHFNIFSVKIKANKDILFMNCTGVKQGKNKLLTSSIYLNLHHNNNNSEKIN